MKKIIFSLTCTLLFNGCQFQRVTQAKDPAPGFASAPSDPAQDPQVIGAKRQLTQVGPRSGEAYFSPDGQKLILQSERTPGNPFYQIYSVDLKTGQSDLLSTGQGKTTCAWFHPNMKKALFASTHLDPKFATKVKEEFELRKAPQKNKYSWSFDDQFDLFEVDLKTKALKPLTKSQGYDAEASFSPDGKWILFASNRTGYTEKLDAEAQKLFEQDPSSQMEIYLMKSDGTQVKRLTNHLGYDGGPFFSADGKKITWRRFVANGSSAEIWTMNVDGTEQKQLTKWGAMSWAPYFHPSGDYVIFTSNKLGYSNFELFIVDSEGKKEPVRVSYWDGFDGLPVFSPDGNQLAWTHRDEKGESQVFLATWNDSKARELLGLPSRAPRGMDLLGSYNPQDAKKVVGFLASEDLQGRMTGTPEETKMTEALSRLMKDMGLIPFSKEGYTVPFEFTSGVELEAGNEAVMKIDKNLRRLDLEKDYLPLSFSQSGKFPEASVAFAGYGIEAPASESQPAFHSYQDLDVQGKWVLVFRDIPEEIPNPKRIHLNQFSRLHHKALVAKQQGAVGLLLVSGPQSSSKQKVMKLRFDGSFAEAGIPVLSISDEVAEQLLSGTGTSLKAWQQKLDTGKTEGVSELPGRQFTAVVGLKDIRSKGHNTLGMIKVPGAKTTLVIGAHGDHLGRGVAGSSLAKGEEQGRIHFGADDNASGVAAILQIAQEMQKQIKAGKFKPQQNILFAIWSGEEIGLLGSNAFLKKFPGPYSAYLNLDMVGRLRDTLLIQGVASAGQWKPLLEQMGIQNQLSLSLQDDPYVPSDAMAFYLKGVPSVHFFTGPHLEYHTPQDTAATLNYEGLSQVAKFVGDLGQRLSQTSKSQIAYQKVESSRKQLEGRKFRVFLGTIPDYTQDKVKGVRISGTSKDSPAEKAGLREGDVITSLGGTKIENLYDYVYVLQALKPNQKVPLEVVRKEQKLNLEITPSVKE